MTTWLVSNITLATYIYLQDHYTPLYAASAKGFNDVVKSLIAANADVNYVCIVS